MPSLPKADIHSRARRAGYDPSILKEACVLDVGVGALGQNLLQDLALSGVGEIRLVDGDTFEEHNRSRSPLHPRRGSYSADEALAKADSVAHELRGLHVEESARILYADTWIEELGLGAFTGVDVIAACVDSLTAREYLAHVAMLLGIPIVDGGFSGANLGMTVYPSGDDPARQPCWSCAGEPVPGAFSCQQYARYSEGSGVVPAIQNGAAALGALCAEAVIALLHNREEGARRVAFDLRSGQSRVFRPVPDPVCSRTHRRLTKTLTVPATGSATVRELLEDVGDGSGGAMILLRESFIEHANCPTCKSTCDVDAPVHRWRRNPMCVDCGGPWQHGADHLDSPDTLDIGLDTNHPRVDLTLEQLGFRPGDIVELAGTTEPTVRLAGGPDGLFARA
jgi:molybdopterin/thiamine biosynthesis adenylyltransferase